GLHSARDQAMAGARSWWKAKETTGRWSTTRTSRGIRVKFGALQTPRRWTAISESALVALASFVLVAGCGKQEPQSFERPPAPVTVATAATQDVPHYIDAIGKFVAREVVSIQPQVSGRITQIHFVDGADVKVGQPLFTIDPRPYQAQVNMAEANLAQAKAALELAKINFDRVASVTDPRAVSRQDYDSKKNAVAIAEAQVKQNQAALESARLNLDYCTIRSPINGRAGQRLVDLGNVVTANSGSLLVIQRLDPIYADFTITESDLTVVQRNMAQGTLKVEARLPEEPDKARARDGKLTFLDNSVQDGTGTVKLRATIANSDRRYWPGRFANIRLILGIQENAVLIPAEAPQMSAKGPYVYVVKPDSTAELRPVTIGQRQGDLVVVNKGITSGEQVVTSGQLGVTPGGKVRIAEPTTVENTPDRTNSETKS
ncbi:MAG TPA: efflux RND transporter periplasmic adaptor subunit, partial [Candidatus Binatia bacterium]|nr:efflux RND transporter periplasmic adaptor subunit [Candidatus Binatia bacterium]